ncbi:MAG TPA: class I SAM-dependent methyltransferase [Candidatus Nitrosotenuis sp.]|jgi:SAM-dependent methyltransferase|nr:class I SAM-dependent methyltransferase [Candidatus Nitrosotenuis sp.]
MSHYIIEDKDFQEKYAREGAYHERQSGFARWFLRRNYRLLAALLPRAGRVLDMGCGEAMLADWLGGVEYHGLDLSPAALELARRRHPRGFYRQGSMTELGALYPPGHFDAAACSLSLMYVGRQPLPATLEQVRTVVRPGGCFVFSYINCDHALHRALADKLRGSGRYIEVESVDGLVRLLEQAGWKVERMLGTNLPVRLERFPPWLHPLVLWLSGALGRWLPRHSYHVVFRCRRN